ncbi:MAG TPA: FMN-binding protein [Aggregatilineales bacterium]|nr:FMN-binding protein [Aggregatilineales bacterium]
MMPQIRTHSPQPFDLMQPVKKFLLSALVIGTFAVYALHERLSGEQAVTVALKGTPGSQPPAGSTNTGAGSSSTSPTASTMPDGQYTGDSADAFYGMVQVSATIQSGRLTDVKFLSYPNDRRTSQEINSQAMPWLQSEAIQAQSAQVDLISGATLTSQAFVQSLQSALDRAHFTAIQGNTSSQQGSTNNNSSNTSAGQYRDGQYTGSIADAFYGNVQVKATIQGGKLSGVQFLSYPNDRRTSQEINSQAMPWLQSEAIQAQSAQVDLISGATLTSEAFVQSLQAALNQARG